MYFQHEKNLFDFVLLYFSIKFLVSRDWIVIQEAKTMDKSITHCRSLGREMVSILSEEDANYYAEITKDIDTSGSSSEYIRIGLQTPNKDCKWSWVGTSEIFTPGDWFWQKGEPNACSSYEFCAMTQKGRKKWNDASCKLKTFFVCGNPGRQSEINDF